MKKLIRIGPSCGSLLSIDFLRRYKLGKRLLIKNTMPKCLCLSVCLSVCLFVCLSLLSISVITSVCLYIHYFFTLHVHSYLLSLGLSTLICNFFECIFVLKLDFFNCPIFKYFLSSLFVCFYFCSSILMLHFLCLFSSTVSSHISLF